MNGDEKRLIFDSERLICIKALSAACLWHLLVNLKWQFLILIFFKSFRVLLLYTSTLHPCMKCDQKFSRMRCADNCTLFIGLFWSSTTHKRMQIKTFGNWIGNVLLWDFVVFHSRVVKATAWSFLSSQNACL